MLANALRRDNSEKAKEIFSFLLPHRHLNCALRVHDFRYVFDIFCKKSSNAFLDLDNCCNMKIFSCKIGADREAATTIRRRGPGRGRARGGHPARGRRPAPARGPARGAALPVRLLLCKLTDYLHVDLLGWQHYRTSTFMQ